MKLSHLLTAQHIIADLQGANKFQIIEELLDLLHQNGQLSNRDQALQDLLAREGYLSTGLENGLAIPHAKTDGVRELIIAFGLKKTGIEFESLDGKPAQLIFLVLSPRDTSGPHIQALASISRNLKDSRVRIALLKARSVDDILAIVKKFEA